MKKTMYFCSQQVNQHLQGSQIVEAIKIATDLRDSFLQENEKTIAKIDSEQIQFVLWNNSTYLIAVIQLNFYEKQA
jgi:DNA-binding protein